MGAKHKKQPKPNTQKPVPLPLISDDDGTDSPSSHHRQQLTVLTIKLISCQTLHEQLQLLRGLDGDSNTVGITADDYRMLLQWMCTHDIPQNLRRVLTSTCGKIRSKCEESASSPSCSVVEESVVNTVLSSARHERDDDDDSGASARCDQSPAWIVNPVQSIYALTEYSITRDLLTRDVELLNRTLKVLSYCASRISSSGTPSFGVGVGASGSSSSVAKMADALERKIEVASTLRLILTYCTASTEIKDASIDQQQQLYGCLLDTISELEVFLRRDCLEGEAHHTDARSISGVAYARLLLLKWGVVASQTIGTDTVSSLQEPVISGLMSQIFGSEQQQGVTGVTDLSQISVLCGFCATLPDKLLVNRVVTEQHLDGICLLCGPFARRFIDMCLNATNVVIRLASLRGLRCVLQRACSIVSQNSCHEETITFAEASSLAQDTLEVALSNWQSATRQIAGAVEPVFELSIKLLQKSTSGNQGNCPPSSFDISGLVRRVLKQPLNRKGRYLALEILLPLVGARTLAETSSGLIPSLIRAVGDTHGHNPGPAKEVLVKLVTKLREEEEDYVSESGDNKLKIDNRKARRRKQVEGHMIVETPPLKITSNWLSYWVISLADSLLFSGRKYASRIMGFCVAPLLLTAGISQAPHVCLGLLEELDRCLHGGRFAPDERQIDQHLWATLEIIRCATRKKVNKFAFFEQSLSRYLPMSALHSALLHSDVAIRVAGFSILTERRQLLTSAEIDLMRQVLPYALKSDSAGYAIEVVDTVDSFLKRMLDHEGLQEQLRKFLLFLLNDLCLQQLSYPGTVLEKEILFLPLFELLFQFTVSTLRKPSKISDIEDFSRAETRQVIVKSFMCDEVFLAFASLIHSMWDSTRAGAYKLLRKLIHHAFVENIDLPDVLRLEKTRASLWDRGYHLAGSPRERESDSGAIMLSILYISSPHEDRPHFLERLVEVADQRVSDMEESLLVIIGKRESTDVVDGRNLPLAHGLIQSLRMCVKEAKQMFPAVEVSVKAITELCKRSLEISLSVVSDVDKGNLNGDNSGETGEHRVSAPLNVNTGALGANGAFATIDAKDAEEEMLRSSMQRVVMGCWLLTKESCAALATATCFSSNPPLSSSVISSVGYLLVSSIISLKHQGGIFAAHRALQTIAVACQTEYSHEPALSGLPLAWSNELLMQISSPDFVRDSILRRSSGYALGLLATMRSETSNGIPSSICPMVLSKLLRLSLPPASIVEAKLKRLGLSGFQFTFSRELQNSSFVDDEKYQWKSRVHALNILRFAILDAPLAKELRWYISDCIISAFIGYDDSSWAVRNSSTMVYASTMLRVIDADKNAARGASKTAITAQELFRIYPALAPVLVAILAEGVEASFALTSSSMAYTLHPSLFPILLLLSRLQPVEDVAADVGAIESVEPFLQHVLRCLSHPHHKVRLMASRAAAALCSGDGNDVTSRSEILTWCKKRYSTSIDWNSKHGILLCVKYLLKISSSFEAFDLIGPLICNAASWGDNNFDAPPSCVAVALECWADAHLRSIISSVIEKSLASSLCAAVHATTKFDKAGVNLIGASHLCCVSSELLAKLLHGDLFSFNDDVRMKTLSTMAWLLQVSFDARWIAAKTIKKSLYELIKKITSDTSVEPLTRAKAMVDVREMLLQTLFDDWKKYVACQDAEVLHPPTLRRMTRSILTISNGIRSLNCTKWCLDDNIWPMLSWLRKFDGTSADKCSSSRCVSLLGGNAVELMAYVLAGQNFGGRINLQQFEEFDSIAKKSIDPLSPWRVRHSIANAIDICGILNVPEDMADRFETKEIHQVSLFSIALNLLQDNDVDVRNAASKAISFASASVTIYDKAKRVLLPQQCTSVVPLLSLERAFKTSQSFASSDQFTEHLFSTIFAECEDIDRMLISVSDQFRLGQNHRAEINGRPPTHRRIFEEEEPNPFLEPLLSLQLSVYVLAGQDPSIASRRTDHVDKLLQKCTVVLAKLFEQLPSDSINDISRCSGVFPYMHGVILGSAAAIYLGYSDPYDIVSVASRILAVETSSRQIHPAVFNAIKMLSESKATDAKRTISGLRRCCFLVPMMTSK